jgi:hypothetical protein
MTKYYIGDLCYVMHDEWTEVCSLACFDNEDWAYELEDGRKFFLFSTAYGDGVYNDGNGLPYSVDSGTIGCIKVDDIQDPEFDSIIKNGLGHIHEFECELEEYDCGVDNGCIWFDKVAIETGGSDDPEDDEDDEDSDD